MWALITTFVVLVTVAGFAIIFMACYRCKNRNRVETDDTVKELSEAYSNYTYSSGNTMESVYDGGPGKHQDLHRMLTSVLTQQIIDQKSSKLSRASRSSNLRSSK